MPQTGVWQFVSGSINNFLSTYVTSASSSIASAIVPMVTAAVTIWIIMYGWATIRGEMQEPVSQFAYRAFKISLILTLALSTSAYQTNIVGFVNGIESGMVETIMHGSTTNVFSALDALDFKTGSLTQMLFERGVNLMPMGGYGDIIAALIIGVASAVSQLFMGGLMLVAQVALALMLAMGPLYIACLAFGPTKKFADGWISKVANYVSLTVFLAVVSAASLSIYETFASALLATAATTNVIEDALGFVTISGALIILILQLPGIAAGLAGGAALSGAGLGSVIVGAMLGGAGKGSGRNKPEAPKGGSVTGSDGSAGGGNTGRGGVGSGGGANPVPAYQRATLERLLGNRY
jgi:type IV secretion system protein VirB6